MILQDDSAEVWQYAVPVLHQPITRILKHFFFGSAHPDAHQIACEGMFIHPRKIWNQLHLK
jgi:hypothetical protein